MGQKTNPIGFRLGIVTDWDSKWYAKGEYADLLHQDLFIKRYVKERLRYAGIARVEIERASDRASVTIHTARPGIVIGRKGVEIERLRKTLEAKTGRQIFINIEEIRKAETNAQLVAENIALQLEKRVGFRRAMKQAVTYALRSGALGIKVACAGRLGGTEMARREWYRQGRVPLHTLRADIDYGFAVSRTTYGVIGVKAWIFKGEVMEPGKVQEVES